MYRHQSRIGRFFDACMDKASLPAALGTFSLGALSTAYGLYNITTTEVLEPLAPYAEEATIGGPILMGVGGIAVGAMLVISNRDR